MKKKVMSLLVLATMLASINVSAAEATTEAVTEAAEEAVERNYTPEEGTGWLAVQINGEAVEFEYTGAAKGMTGTSYSFEAENYTLVLMFNKKLEVGEEMETNAITQIEIMSHATVDTGYYFTKKAANTDVVSTVTLEESEGEGITQGVFTVVVPTAERYVGDNKPGILPELDLTEGEFCFYE